jgi:hypothetical protein
MEGRAGDASEMAPEEKTPRTVSNVKQAVRLVLAALPDSHPLRGALAARDRVDAFFATGAAHAAATEERVFGAIKGEGL